jgi:hypothetical protein
MRLEKLEEKVRRTYRLIEDVDGQHVCLCRDGGDGTERDFGSGFVRRLGEDDLDVVERG